MKFKKWVSGVVLVINIIFILMLFTEPIVWNLIGLIGLAVGTYLLTKYAKFCDYERRK